MWEVACLSLHARGDPHNPTLIIPSRFLPPIRTTRAERVSGLISWQMELAFVPTGLALGWVESLL